MEVQSEPKELMDLVDIDDNVIGTIDRSEIASLSTSERGFVRAVGVFILNSQGRLWVPKRGAHKKIAPNGLDFSAGEHVGAGESYEHAALRGMEEELNISNPDASKLHLIGKLPPLADLPYFHNIYTYDDDELPDYNRDDFSGYELLYPAELAAKLEAGTPAKGFLLPSVQLLLHNQA
jgi:isopentenyldiphosphate isomerase